MKEAGTSTAISKAITMLCAVAIAFFLVLAAPFAQTGSLYSFPVVTPAEQYFIPTNAKRYTYKFNSGTGFFITNYHIVTNAHVVKQCDEIRVRGAVKPTRAKVVGIDKAKDLAILKVNKLPVRVATLRENIAPVPGEAVTIMGYPLDHGVKGDYLVKEAVVKELNNKGWIFLSDAVKYGNSGGPVLDSEGNVIGVVVGKMEFYRKEIDPITSEVLSSELVETKGVAIDLPTLKSFLNKHNVFYKRDTVQNSIAAKHVENKAKQYIVNIHCILPEKKLIEANAVHAQQ